MIEWLNDEMSTPSLMWLFLAAFMLHDFEEMIIVESWMRRNWAAIDRRAPRFIRQQLASMKHIRSDQFAFAVLLEFILFIPITWLAVEHGQYLLFTGINIALFLHVFTHIGQSLYLRRYTPGVITAVLITLPYSYAVLDRMLTEELIDWNLIGLSIPCGLLLLPVILIGHRLAPKLLPKL